MAETIKVSVIVPTYRRKASLYDALISIVQQTYKNVEIILVDDNADIEWNYTVQKIVQEISDCRINHLINKINQGSAKTRNLGIASASGEYITFLDDDDIYLPEKIEKQLAAMVSINADYGITDLELYNSFNQLIEKRTRAYIQDTSKESLLRYHLLYHLTGTDTLMFRTDYLKRIEGFPEIDVGDEFYLMERAILGGGKMCYLPCCYVKAYVHEGDSLGLSSGQRKIEGENTLYKEKKKYFNTLSNKDQRYIRMRHYAVIAFARLREKKFFSCAVNGTISFFSSPAGCFQMLKQRK